MVLGKAKPTDLELGSGTMDGVATKLPGEPIFCLVRTLRTSTLNKSYDWERGLTIKKLLVTTPGS